MEKWKIGKMENWNVGMLECWKNGKLENPHGYITVVGKLFKFLQSFMVFSIFPVFHFSCVPFFLCFFKFTFFKRDILSGCNIRL